MAQDKQSGEPASNFDVTENSGYTFEKRVPLRNSNGWGGTQTQLPVGHLARRDTNPSLGRMIVTENESTENEPAGDPD